MTNDGKTRRTEVSRDQRPRRVRRAFSQTLLDGGDPSPSGIDGLRRMQLPMPWRSRRGDGVAVRIAS